MWDARLLGLLPAEVHTTSSFHLLGCVKKEIWDPLKAMVVDNFCNTWWHWCALVAIVNSDALHLSKPLPRCVKMENSKHVIEYIVIQYRKLQFGQLFLQKFDFFLFLADHLHTVVKDEFLFKNSILLIYCCQLIWIFTQKIFSFTTKYSKNLVHFRL